MCNAFWAEHTFDGKNDFWDMFMQFQRNVFIFWQMLDVSRSRKLHAHYRKTHV